MVEPRATIAAPWSPSGAQLGLALGGALIGIAVLFWRTFASLVDVWTQSDTFAHGFVIAPISLFLIWRCRQELRVAPKRPSFAGLGAVLALSAAWLVATIAEVQVGQQLAAVLLIPAAVVAVLGAEASKRIAFPLGFLVFAVPFGEALIPALMDFTASFTVAALRITDIPVLREGFFFKIPSGDFEVAKACSGIRYLIACLTLGVLYSHLAFRSWYKRAAFVAISIVAPIIANGVRAYLIVLVAHLSNMRLAVGVDHLIYGWLFFGALVAMLFWIGSWFADPAPAPRGARVGVPSQPVRGAALVAAAAATIAFAAFGPVVEARRDVPSSQVRRPAVPASIAGWEGPAAGGAPWWRPPPETGIAVSGRYVSAAGAVDLTVLTFEPGTAEVVGSIRRLVDDAGWQVLEARRARVPAAGDDFAINEVVVRSRPEHAVIWYWYVIGTTPIAADWHAKVLEAWHAIRDGYADSALVALSARAADADTARATLRPYLQTSFASLNACAAGPAPGCVPAGR